MTTGKVVQGDEPWILCAWGPTFRSRCELGEASLFIGLPASAPKGAEEGRPRQFYKEQSAFPGKANN